MMMKSYENLEMKITFLLESDVVRTSRFDNVEQLPEFPEDFMQG